MQIKIYRAKEIKSYIIIPLCFFALICWETAKPQTFVPLPLPVYSGILYECSGGGSHYALLSKPYVVDYYYLCSFDGIWFTPVDSFYIPQPMIHSMGYSNDEIYLGGQFDTVNGIYSAKGLMKYNLSTREIKTASDIFKDKILITDIFAIKPWKGQLLMCGSFQVFDSTGSHQNPIIYGGDTTWAAIDNSLYWNGSTCQASNRGHSVYIENDSSFYMKAAVLKIDNLQVNGIAHWNKDHWEALGNGLPAFDKFGFYTGIVKYGNKIFVIYDDSIASHSNPVIAYYENGNWYYLDDGTEPANNLLPQSCGLFVTYGNTNTHKGLALYDEQLGFTNLSGVDSVSYNTVQTIFSYNGYVYANGLFFINSYPARFGRIDCALSSVAEDATMNGNIIYPVPASDKIHINISQTGFASNIRILNSYGQCLKYVISYFHDDEIDVSDLPPGIYFLDMDTGNGRNTCRFIISK